MTAGTVTHCLTDADARLLGRVPGVGIAFCEPAEPGDELFAIAVDRLVRARRAHTSAPGLHVLVADAEPRVLERMSTALGEAGFSVETASTGMEVLAACLRRRPDVLIVDRALPVLDGFRVIERMSCLPELATVPVIVTSSDPNDLAAAFEHGAEDFVGKPFTALEVIARARRLAMAAEPAMLRGSLAAISVGALLTLCEQERKTGRLTLTGEQSVWIDLVDGRVVGAGPSSDAYGTLTTVLTWSHGTFELSASTSATSDPKVAIAVTHLLLEAARLHDESRPARTAQGTELTRAAPTMT